jgi:hypothetical protein
MTTSGAPEPSPDLQPWPPLWARKIAFFCGLGLMVYEAVPEHSRHIAVYGLAFMLTGLPIARGLDKAVDLIAGLKGR